MASEHFNIDESNPELAAFARSMAEKEKKEEEKLNPTRATLKDIKARALALGPPQFTEDDEDNALTFEFFLAVNRVIVTCAYRQIEPQLTDLKLERREALENYEDDLFEDLVLKTVLLEQKAIDKFKDFVYPQVEDLRTRDLIKAKVKYLMDAE